MVLPAKSRYLLQLPRATAALFSAYWLNVTAACQYQSTRLMVIFTAGVFFSLHIKIDVS